MIRVDQTLRELARVAAKAVAASGRRLKTHSTDYPALLVNTTVGSTVQTYPMLPVGTAVGATAPVPSMTLSVSVTATPFNQAVTARISLRNDSTWSAKITQIHGDIVEPSTRIVRYEFSPSNWLIVLDPNGGSYTATVYSPVIPDRAQITGQPLVLDVIWTLVVDSQTFTYLVPGAIRTRTAQQLQTDFGSYALGWPTGWSVVFDTATGFGWAITSDAGATAGKILRNSTTVAARRGMTLDAAELSGDTRVMIRARSNATAGSQVGIVLRASGITRRWGYVAELYDQSIRVVRIVDNAETVLATAPFTWTTGQWVRIRAQAVGSTLSARAWIDGSTEPTTWAINVSDPAPVTIGYVGVGSVDIGTHDYDLIAIGTNGAAAPA